MTTRGRCFVGWGGRIGLLLGLCLLAGCQGGGTEVGNPAPSTLEVRFASDQDLENYIKEQFAGAVLAPAEIPPISSTPPAADPGAGSEGTPDYSDTNVQEAGVDEADKVKTDGNYLYIAQQDGVRIVKLEAGGAMSDIAKVATDGPVDALYLVESRLVVLYQPIGSEGSDWCGAVGLPVVGSSPAVMPCWIPVQAKTAVLMVDVQDPANPLRLSDQLFDGDLVSSRRIGSRLHLVSRFMPTLPPLDYFYDGTETGKVAAVQRNLQALQTLTLDQLIPAFQTRDAGGNVIQSGRLLGSETFIAPTLPQGGSIVTVLTFDLNQTQPGFQAVGAVLDVRDVYASTSALYLTGGDWNFGRPEQPQTFLHKFDLSGPAPVYAASGKVPGTILNQFSMSEYQNVLRVATSTGNWWSAAGRGNNVYCLSQGEKGLEIVGRLENLAPGESIYAARFIGPRGFLVTFVQVDPLFTLDLSDPTAPKVVGELKTPGFSTYLHPLGENHLLAIGQSGIVNNLGNPGVQLSIFAVGDFANPTLLFQEEIGDLGTWSEAQYNHKAFTYWVENGLLAIPVDLYEHQTLPLSPWERGQQTFSGLYVYRVDTASGFSLQGRIATQTGSPNWTYNPWTRGLFAAGSVYAVTPPGVFSAQISDIANTVNHLDISQ